MASPTISPGPGSLPLNYLRISDMLADWPWQRRINPVYEEVAAESNAWLRSFSPLNLKSQHAFEKGDFGLLAALTFPDVPPDQLRTGVDLFNVLFLVDEYTDVEPAPRVRGIVDVCIDALHNPGKLRPNGEGILGELVRQFWERGQRTVPHQSGKPFVAAITDFLNSVVAEAEGRDSGAVLTAEAYRATRLQNIGARPFYVLGGLFLSIPDHLYEDDPLLAAMIHLGCEIITIDNDIVSYNRERAHGNAEFNIVAIAMHHQKLNLDDAVRSLVERNAGLEAQYLQFHREFCSIHERPGGAVEGSRIRRYLDHIGNMRRACWCWSFECGRYFGERGSTYAKTLIVPLVPKIIRDDVLLMEEELAKLE